MCDRCGFVYNHDQLVWQFDYRGPVTQNLRILVCHRCLDKPQAQRKSIVVPADPTPITNPRPLNYVDPPTLSLDFKNGVYAINGVSAAVTDCLYEDAYNFAPYNPAQDIVPGIGLAGNPSGAGSSPLVKTPALTNLIGGFTAVLDWTQGPFSANYLIALLNLNYSNVLQIYPTCADNGQPFGHVPQINDLNGGAAYGGDNPTAGTHRTACTITPKHMAMCTDGGAVVTYTPGAVLPTSVGISLSTTAGASLQKVTFLPPTPDSMLSALSS